MKHFFMALCLLCVMTSAALAQENTAHKAATQENAVWYRVYLGMGVGKAQVSADVVRDFLAREVTPRFPQGFAIITARGQWNSPEGLIRENNTILDLQGSDTPEIKDKIDAIAAAYAKRFAKARASIYVVRIPGVTTELKFERQ